MTDTQLPGVFSDMQPVLEHWGYLGVGGMLFLEDFGVPVPGEIVTVARFIDGLRQINGLLAGIGGMGWLKFLGYNALGAVLWVGTWCALGYLAGENIVDIYDTFERYKWYVIGALAVVVAIVIAHRVRRRRAERTA
jgi:membrane protein DedA with SNARE-associated domain